MLLRIALYLTLALGVATPSVAATPKPKPTPKPTPSPAPPPPPPPAPSPSPSPAPPPPPPAPRAHVEKRPLLYADLKLISFGYPTDDWGLTLGMNVWKLLSLELTGETGSRDLNILDVKIAEFRQYLYGGAVRLYPLLGKFNIKAFYGQRWLRASLQPGGYEIMTDVSLRQQVAGVGLGTRWQFDLFFFDVDWVMYYHPLDKGKVSSEVLGGDPSDPDREFVESRAKKLQNTDSATALNLAIGIGW